jgi:hypothetical protein
MPTHAHDPHCPCPRCTRERPRLTEPSAHTRSRRSRRRAKRLREEYWDAWESGRPEWDDWPIPEE